MSANTNQRTVQPYLSFEGRCQEAFDFYRKAIGAEVTTLPRYKDSPVSLALTILNEADAERLFAALCEGGQVHLPLTKTSFSERFGMIADRFDVPWMIQSAPQGQR